METYHLTLFQLTLPDVDTRMRPALTNQIPAQQAHVPPLLAPVPTRPPTGHQVMPMVVKQISPQRQDYQAPLQHVMTPPVHQPAHPYYGQEYYPNHLHQHQLNYPPQEQFPPLMEDTSTPSSPTSPVLSTTDHTRGTGRTLGAGATTHGQHDADGTFL
ncbi:hypothetical protein PCANC_15125 [Puccinia coronata f. sp. avenae]|uniref:Uncharacterized protein n=1 Tax=Puccinia coronata f. sp. avenae TaxID=200324 RepID=A0A2N5SR09_9BASI|nr:hypothetical protein PCANC_15125 [Puccinia coronata f. sp. avenae]